MVWLKLFSAFFLAGFRFAPWILQNNSTWSDGLTNTINDFVSGY
jgi:hypothetical protein